MKLVFDKGLKKALVMERFDHQKALRYIESGALLRLKQYIIRFEKKNINFTLDFKTGKLSRTPLHMACSFGDDAIARCLIKHGAKINIRDRKGNTPMHLAAKYILEKSTYSSYKLLIDPLLKGYPDGLHQKNQEGKSPMDFLNAAKDSFQDACKERNEAKQQENIDESGSSGDEKDKKSEIPSKEENLSSDITWEEKLANELSNDCADLGDDEKFGAGVWNTPKLQTFDQWADKMADEYRRKHKFSTPNRSNKMTKRQKFMEQQEEKLRQDKEREMYIKAVETRNEQELEKKHQKYQDSLARMKSATTGTKKLRFKDIPWPCRGTMDEMIQVVMKGLEPGCDNNTKKKYITRQLVLWHPDKFHQRCYQMLDDEDKDTILSTVKCLSQELNKLKDELK